MTLPGGRRHGLQNAEFRRPAGRPAVPNYQIRDKDPNVPGARQHSASWEPSSLGFARRLLVSVTQKEPQFPLRVKRGHRLKLSAPSAREAPSDGQETRQHRRGLY